MHGQFVWYDLMTSDVAAAKKFYPTVLGWKANAWEHSAPGQPYTLWTQGGVPLGGVAQFSDEMRAQGMRSHWIPTVEVRDVDESTTLARSLGAQVHFGPEDIPGTGRYVSLADPQGASFAMFAPARPTLAFDGTPLLGRFSWHELMTTDYQQAFDFYRRLFDWQKTSDFDMGGGNTYLMFGMSGKPYGGIYNRAPEMGQVPPNWLSYVHVKDVRKATAAARRAGARLVNGPMEVPGGDWIAAFTDPQGASFAIHQLASQAALLTTTSATPEKPSTSSRARKARKDRPPSKANAVKPRKKSAAKKRASKKTVKTRARSRATAKGMKRRRRR